jgi:DNA-binding PadR family transcriptional regulator
MAMTLLKKWVKLWEGYCPSAGTIYPTLNYLEEQLFVQVALDD